MRRRASPGGVHRRAMCDVTRFYQDLGEVAKFKFENGASHVLIFAALITRYAANMQLYDPGSKFTKPPVPALNQEACCVACMEDPECVAAELYGQTCYPKTKQLPLVPQTPPPGVPLVACIQNRSAADGGPVGGPGPRAVPAHVPGDVLAALERADLLGIANQSIYHGRNLQKASVQAAQNASYWLNTTFSGDATLLKSARIVLVLDGIDYNATVFVNGRKIGAHAGPYHVGRIAVASGLLNRGPLSNELALRFEMAPPSLLKAWFGPGNGAQDVMWDKLDWWKSMVGIGYDFAENFWSIGVQEGVQLVGTAGQCLINDLAVLPKLRPPYTQAMINASLAGTCHQEVDAVAVVWTVRDSHGDVVATTSTSAEVDRATGQLRGASGASLVLDSPELWWPHGLGLQPMYDIEATVRVSVHPESTNNGPTTVLSDSDTANRSFGIRDLKQVRNTGPTSWTYIEEFGCSSKPGAGGGFNCSFPESLIAAGESPASIESNRNWTFQINGKRIFAKGANWLPCDMRIGECRTADYEYFLQAAIDANMNFLRVWGGGGIEKKVFYDLCDRLGLMVYQETMHSQSMPTRDINFENEAVEIRDMIVKLSTHPSVVRYGWGNEYYGVNRSSNRFERQYEEIANDLDPTRAATHGSPVTWADRHGPYCFYLSNAGPGRASFPCFQSPGYKAYNGGANAINWMNQEGPNDPFEWDEYGAAGASSEYTISQTIPRGSQYPINSTNVDYIFHRAYDAVGPSAMWLTQDSYLPLFGQPQSLAEEVAVSQWTQMEGLRYANQAHRRRMPHRTMCAFWTLNEPWPNAAYGSVVDWFGVKKMAYYAGTRAAYSPVDVSLVYSSAFLVASEKLPVITAWVVSEQSIARATLTLSVSTTSGAVLHVQTWPVAVSVGNGEMGAAKRMGALVDWASVPAALAREVLLFRLSLDHGNTSIAQQLYTFGVLQAGSSVDAPLGTALPMRPLLNAPETQCTISQPVCSAARGASRAPMCTVEISSPLANKAPCLYLQLELFSPHNSEGSRLNESTRGPQDPPQFHAATFSDNYLTLFSGDRASVTFAHLDYRRPGSPTTPASKLELCMTGWNSPRTCATLT